MRTNHGVTAALVALSTAFVHPPTMAHACPDCVTAIDVRTEVMADRPLARLFGVALPFIVVLGMAGGVARMGRSRGGS